MNNADSSQMCPESLGERDSYFHEVYGDDPPTRVLHQSENFLVMCDFAPLLLGHLLLIPRESLLSFGRVPHTQWGELLNLKAAVVKILSETYAPPIILEHGSSLTMTGGGCVSHAHWHILPADINFLESFEREQFTVTKIDDERDLMKWGDLDIPYIYFEDTKGEKFVAEDVEFLRRQYIRIEIARFLNIEPPYWNWRVFANKELLRETMKTLSLMSWPDIRDKQKD